MGEISGKKKKKQFLLLYLSSFFVARGVVLSRPEPKDNAHGSCTKVLVQEQRPWLKQRGTHSYTGSGACPEVLIHRQ